MNKRIQGKILKVNLDSNQWDEISPTEFRLEMKMYTQSSIYEQDYYDHVKRIEREGSSFFTPRPKFNAPNVTFLMWDTERMSMKNIHDLRIHRGVHMGDKRLPIIKSYILAKSRNKIIDNIVSLPPYRNVTV